MTVRLAEHRIVLDAPASEVYRHLTTVEGLLRWIAVDAIAEPVPGGRLEWTHENGATMVGRFLELDPPRRVVIAYGWKGGLMGVPPESTIVEIDLEEQEGRTTLSLVHKGIPSDVVDDHSRGWAFFMRRLYASTKSLVDLMAPRSGHFRFESGHHGDRWLEPDLLLQRPATLRPFAEQLADRLKPYRFEAVCGPLTGGAFLAQFVAERCNASFAFAERFAPPPSNEIYPVTYRIPYALRANLRGRTVAIVNDVTNAGSAVRGTYTDLIACGAQPVALGTLLVLGRWSSDFAADNHLGLEALDTLPNNLWLPAECPLCASRSPLEDPSASQ